MPQIGNKHYGYDKEGMREYIKDKNAMSEARYGRSHFPMADDGDETKDSNKDGVVDILEDLNMDNSAVTNEGGVQGDIDGDGIPENYVDSEKRKGNLKQTGWRRYVDKNLGVDLELLASDFKKSWKNPVFTKSPSITDLPSNPTKYKHGGTPPRVKATGGATGYVPGMYQGRNK